MRILVPLLLASLALAGCSGSPARGGDGGTGDFELQLADNLATGRLELRGAYLRAAGGWAEALGNGTAFDLTGAGGNLTQAGSLKAGDYDRLRLLFGDVTVNGRKAQLTQSGIELAANVTVPKGGAAGIALVFSWTDSVFESAQGLAFTPVLTRLVVTQDGAETQRLEASEIVAGNGKAPVARMRVFDATGLEAFVSTFVADSPEEPVIGNAGNLTLSGSASSAVQAGTTIKSYSWDIDGTTLTGNTVTWPSPISGGNFTVRLTVTDSEDAQDTQTVRLALKPSTATRSVAFEGEASGAGGTQGVQEHTWAVNTTELDGAPAELVHVTLTLTPGSATVPVSDLDVTLDDGAAKRLGSATGTGSQHKIDVDVTAPSSGTWKVRVIPDPAIQADYTVQVTLTYKGSNPGIEAFLAQYDDGHTHVH